MECGGWECIGVLGGGRVLSGVCRSDGWGVVVGSVLECGVQWGVFVWIVLECSVW